MGAWGAGLYQDDTACDIRQEYRGLIAQGLEEPEASNALMKKLGYASQASDVQEYDEVVAWLALADTQHTLGRLAASVKNEVLQLIENGRAMELLAPLLDQEDKGFLEARQKVLTKLAEKLRTPQKAAKKIARKRFSVDPGYVWNLGEVYAYENGSELPILLVPFAWHELPEFHDGKERVKTPLFYLLDWKQTHLPSEAEVRGCQFRMFAKGEYLREYQPIALLLYCKKTSVFPAKLITALNVTCKSFPSPITQKTVIDEVGIRIQYVQNNEVIFENISAHEDPAVSRKRWDREEAVRPSYYTMEWKQFDAWLSGDHSPAVHVG